MGKKNSHWIKSIIAVFLIAIVLFLIIYFFAPTLSLKFFGIAFGEESRVSTALQDLLIEKSLDPIEVEELLDSAKGQEVIDALVDGAKKGSESISEFLSSEQVKEITDTIKDTTKEAVGNIQAGAEV